MPTQQEVLADPDFQQLPDADKLTALKTLFPSDFAEGGDGSTGTPTPPPAGAALKTEDWVTTRGSGPSLGSRMFDWFNPEEMIARRNADRGLTGSVLDIAGVPEGNIKSGLEALGTRVIDPVVGNVNAILGGVFSPAKVAMEPLSALEDVVMPKLLAPDTLAPEAFPSVGATAQADIKAQIAGHPASTALALYGAKQGAFPGLGKAPKATAGVKANSAVDLLQKQIKPSATSQLGQEFETIGAEYLRQAAPESVKIKGKPHDVAINSGEAALTRLGGEQSAMLADAKARGVTHVDPAAIRQAHVRLANEPYYKYVDPEAGARFQALGESVGPIPIEEAQAVLSDINAKQRLARQRTGASEDSVEVQARYQANEAMADAIRDQLNELLSRTPNEFKENYRSYSNVAQVTDQLIKSKATFRNSDQVTLGAILKRAAGRALAGGGAGTIAGAMFGSPIAGAVGGAFAGLLSDLATRTRVPKNISKSLKMANKMDIQPPKPFGPQKPSMLPEPPPQEPPPDTGGNVPVAPTPTAPLSPAGSPLPGPLEPPRDVVSGSLGSRNSGLKSSSGGSISMKTYMDTQIDLMTKSGMDRAQSEKFILGGGSPIMRDVVRRLLAGEIDEAAALTEVKTAASKLL